MAPTSIIALPNMCPVPVAMVLHTLGLGEEAFLDMYQHANQKLLKQLTLLEQQVQTAQEWVYPLMIGELQRRHKLPLTWLQETIATQINNKPHLRATATMERTYSASYRTLLSWKNNSVLVAQDMDRIAAILTISIVDERRQGFLPAAIDPDTPQKWCYAKVSPTAPVLPCPLPAPILPRGTLLFTRWPTFDEDWLLLPPPGIAMDAPAGSFMPIGAIRFSSLDLPALARWDPSLTNAEARMIFGNFASQKKTLSKLAETVLFRLAPDVFAPDVIPPALPLVYDRQELYDSLNHVG